MRYALRTLRKNLGFTLASTVVLGLSIGAADPLTFTAAPLLLIAVAAAACWFPARRAMRIEPIIALCQE